MAPRLTAFTELRQVAHRHEADQHLSKPGIVVIVHRGVARSLVFKCPDNCGDTLTINLDRRTGPAWRFFQDRRGFSLYPSVWKDTGCESHFILWRSQVLWCDYDEPLADESDVELERLVSGSLSAKLVSYADIADTLNEVPWNVLVACRRLVRIGGAEEGEGKQRGSFRTAVRSGPRRWL